LRGVGIVVYYSNQQWSLKNMADGMKKKLGSGFIQFKFRQ